MGVFEKKWKMESMEKEEEEEELIAVLPWESIPSESGIKNTNHFFIPQYPLYHSPIFSESGLICLAIYALQGMESALLTIEKLCTTFDADPADRTFLRIPNMWKRTSSTLAFGRILKSIGCSGCIVFLLRKFVDHFEKLHLDGSLSCNILMSVVAEEKKTDSEPTTEKRSPQSLVNQAFSVAVRKFLEGCMAAVDTLYASVSRRRSAETVDMSRCSFLSGCLTRSDNSEVTLLEVYLHSKELRTQIDVIGNICQLQDKALCFSGPCLDDLVSKAKAEFLDFPRGGELLTYLYSCLRDADPVHNALLKFLFLRTCEPYCEFIRSWIYKAEICDPYKEFMIEYVVNLPSYSPGEAGSSYNTWLAAVKERDGVVIPCFLKDMCIPIFRAGQQLQILMKLLELSGHVNTENFTYSDILPCWSVFSSDYFSDASPFSFNRERIEAMALARSIYYRSMMSKMDIILEKLGSRFQQVVSHGTVLPFIGSSGGSQEIPLSLRNIVVHISPSTDTELIVENVDSEASNTTEEFPSVEDQLDSTECSSLDGSEEQNEFEQSIQFYDRNGHTSSSTLEMLARTCDKVSLSLTCNYTYKPEKGDLYKLHDIIDANNLFTDPCLRETNLRGNHLHDDPAKSNRSWFSETQSRYNVYNKGPPFSRLVSDTFSVDEISRHDATSLPLGSGLKVSTRNMGVFSEYLPYLTNSILTERFSVNETNNNSPFAMTTCSSSISFRLPILSLKGHSNPLSMNPVLFKTDLVRKPDNGICAGQIDHLPFDFSSVKDPCEIRENSLASSCRYNLRSETSNYKHPNTYAAIGSAKFQNRDSYDGQETLPEKNAFNHVNFTLSSGNNTKEDSTSTNICGGSSWESMLSCLGNTTANNPKIRQKSLAVTFEIPLDFVIEKCLLQEILHQYWYISKLTIKLLEEGFNLREHFSALRRYHFMELADWADLFIFSLWNRKWGATEEVRTVSEIQGLLAISLQKSSCDKDACRDRLFVFVKENEKRSMPLLIPTIGISSNFGIGSFNFLGLGYKVDWPISIVLTPSALEIYGQIFSFLLRIRLAIFALTDSWCLMKEILNFNTRNLYAKERKLVVQGPQSGIEHLNTLTIVRHQIYHFVTTLQQYVQSQLSHDSCCRFTDSLNNKVKDMMDLESVHVAYLNNAQHMKELLMLLRTLHVRWESLKICFLSDEMRVVAIIIENILQCAVDLRFCFLGTNGDDRLRGEFPDHVSWIDLSQIRAVKQAFQRNLEELHMCFVKAPKQLEYGLARFWGLLNYNEHYSDFTDNGNYRGF